MSATAPLRRRARGRVRGLTKRFGGLVAVKDMASRSGPARSSG